MIKLITCGKLKEKWMKMACDEYCKRIKGYERLELFEVADEKTPDQASAAQNEKIKIIEGERILSLIKPNDFVILLDLQGETKDSVGFANFLDTQYTYGNSNITFVIGGSLGVSKELIQRANFRWKLSDQTFPHQLCKIIVLEQIYRSFKILKNEPYHK